MKDVARGKRVGLSISDTRRWTEPLNGVSYGDCFRGEDVRKREEMGSGQIVSEFVSRRGAYGGSLDARDGGHDDPNGAERPSP